MLIGRCRSYNRYLQYIQVKLRNLTARGGELSREPRWFVPPLSPEGSRKSFFQNFLVQAIRAVVRLVFREGSSSIQKVLNHTDKANQLMSLVTAEDTVVSTFRLSPEGRYANGIATQGRWAQKAQHRLTQAPFPSSPYYWNCFYPGTGTKIFAVGFDRFFIPVGAWKCP